VGEILMQQARNSGDIVQCVSQNVGRIPRCKVGDFLLTLGPESAAPRAGIVFEAKEDRSYDLRKMVDELAQARENRGAQVGIAVLSKATAPEGIEPLTRFGSDIIVVWDRDDTTSDVLFTAALSLARALVVRERSRRVLTGLRWFAAGAADTDIHRIPQVLFLAPRTPRRSRR
jgi:hypothetical protein